MSILLAPVLQEVAARVGGQDPGQRRLAPDRWAYALRDAVALARPDWIVTHHDLGLEADAIASLEIDLDDLLDADLAASPQGAAALELTATLAALYPGGVVAASLTGPATTVARLAEHRAEAVDDLATAALDCGDPLAALAAAHAERGARRIVVWEPQAEVLEPGDLAQAHEPILRRLALLDVEAVIAGPPAVHEAGYARSASAVSGQRAALLPASAFSGREQLAGALAEASRLAGEDGVVLSGGPVPGDCDLAALGDLAKGIEGGVG